MEGAEEGIERMVDSKDMQQHTKAFDNLTDHSRASQTRVLNASAEADWQAMRLREKELAAVKINVVDVEITSN